MRSTALALVVPATRRGRTEPPTAFTKIDSALEDALRSGAATQNVIITLKPGYRAQMRERLQEHGDVVQSEHASIDALVVKLHSADVSELADRDEVAALALDSDVYADGANADSSRSWSAMTEGSNDAGRRHRRLRSLVGDQHAARDARTAPVANSSTLTGSAGVGVVIIDSGMTPSANFSGRITGFYDFVKGKRPLGGPVRRLRPRHACRRADRAAAASCRTTSSRASRRTCRLVVLKVLDGTGQGRTSDVIRALEFVVANKTKLNAQIINLSLGHPIYAPAMDDPLVQAVQKATAAGYIVVTSAGNRGVNETTGLPGYGGVSSPCNAPSAICVGAANTQNTVKRSDDVVAPYSGAGRRGIDGFAKPDVVAPGPQARGGRQHVARICIRRCRTAAPGRGTASRCWSLSGTSMGAGVASGVAALVVDAHNRNGFNSQKPLTANLVKAIARVLGDSRWRAPTI